VRNLIDILLEIDNRSGQGFKPQGFCLAMAHACGLFKRQRSLYAGEMHKGYVKTEAQIFSREEQLYG
jgi:hypothetical protein